MSYRFMDISFHFHFSFHFTVMSGLICNRASILLKITVSPCHIASEGQSALMYENAFTTSGLLSTVLNSSLYQYSARLACSGLERRNSEATTPFFLKHRSRFCNKERLAMFASQSIIARQRPRANWLYANQSTYSSPG